MPDAQVDLAPVCAPWDDPPMSNHKIVLCAASCLVLCLAAFSSPQDKGTSQDQERVDAKIHELMRVSGAGDLGKQVMDQMLDAFRGMPNLPEGFLEKFRKSVDVQELVDLIVPVYRTHLDEATLDAVLAFAATPEGKKFYAAQPAILKESMAIGQKWGQEVAMKVLRDG